MVEMICGILFICLLGIVSFTIYKQKNHKTEQTAITLDNAVGEKQRRDFPVIELQRQQIDTVTVFRFESKHNDESYELDEEQLDVFAQRLNSINSGKEFGKIEDYQSIEDKDLYRKEIENREKKYFQFDNEL